MVYNALPHFPNPGRLIRCLSEKLLPGGRLTIGHNGGRADINSRHQGEAASISISLIHEDELAALFAPYFDVDVKVSNDELYVISGSKR